MPDEEVERNMYWYVKNFLELNGYKQYEISNFAKPGFESKHNLDCWMQKEYIGVGLAAHSYLDNIRFSNTENMKEYLKNCQNNEIELNKIINEIQNTESKQKEYMILGLRKIEGIYVSEFKKKFNANPLFIFKNELNELVQNNLINIDLDKIQLTNKGLDFANIVWEKFI